MPGIYSGYDDPTGKAVPSNEKMHRGYQPLTTSVAGQHLYNTVGDPTEFRDEVDTDDLWIDTTPA